MSDAADIQHARRIMTVTVWTWLVAVGGLVLITLLSALQVVALVRPRSKWTISNVYGGDPASTDPVAS